MNLRIFKVAELVPHPLSGELFGQLEEDLFLDLANDIKRRGLQDEPKVDVYSRVICGSQRLRAIKYLGWEEVRCCIHDELKTEEEIEEFLILRNTQRRQLKERQMYAAGKRLEHIWAGQAEKNRLAGLKRGKEEGVPIDDKTPIGKVQERVGTALGVSGDKFQNLKTVYERGSAEVQDQVDQGSLSVTAAAKRIKASEGPRRPKKLAPDDTRAAALNWMRFDREVEKWEKFLKANQPGKYGQYEGEVRGRVEKLRARIDTYLALKTGEKTA